MSNIKAHLYSEDKDFRLRKVETNDLSFLMELRNHTETQKFLGTNIKLTMQMQEQWLSTLKTSKDKVYYVYEKFEQKANNVYGWTSIGMVRTHDIDNFNKHMGVGGDIIPEQRGQGYATIMYRLIFKLAFEKLKFHRLWLSVIEYNFRARNLYKKMGFKETGIQRNAVFKENKYYDYVYMDILETEYNQK